MIPGILFLLASIFVLGTGIGLLRLPDPLSRLHASTKAATMGSALALLAAVIDLRDLWVTLMAALTMVFIFLTAPVGAHAIASQHEGGPDDPQGRDPNEPLDPDRPPRRPAGDRKRRRG